MANAATRNLNTHHAEHVKDAEEKYSTKEILRLISSPLIISVLSIVSLGLAIRALMVNDDAPFNWYGSISDVILIQIYLFIMFGIVKFTKSIDTNNSHHKTKTKAHPISFITLTFLVILGFGDSLFNLTRLGDQFIIILNQNYPSNNECKWFIATSAIENALRCACQLCILMFLMFLMENPHQSKTISLRIFASGVSVFSFFQWLMIIFQEIEYEKNEHEPHSRCKLNSTAFIKSFEDIEPFLYPLGIEFRFACFIEYLAMADIVLPEKYRACYRIYTWLSRVVYRVGEFISSMVKLLFQRMIGKIRCFSACTSVGRSSYRKPFSYIFLRTSGIFLVSISMIFVFFQDYNSNKTNIITIISESCEIVLGIAILVHTIRSLQKSSATLGKEININRHFKIDFMFMLFAISFMLIYCCLTLIGASIYVHSDQMTLTIKSLTIIASIIPLIQTPLQVTFIWEVRKDEIKSFRIHNDMWIILSFAIWLFDTFSAKKFSTNTIQTSYFDHWNIWAAICVPMTIFFRFHSCVVFAKMKAGVYADQEHSLDTELEVIGKHEDQIIEID